VVMLRSIGGGCLKIKPFKTIRSCFVRLLDLSRHVLIYVTISPVILGDNLIFKKTLLIYLKVI